MSIAVAVGLTTLDVVERINTPPTWGDKSVSDSVELLAGGPAANAAVTCAAMLGAATLVSAVGSGAAAEVVRADLAAHGVRLVDIAPPGWQLPVAVCLVTPDGERTVISPGATASVVRLDEVAQGIIRGADAVLVDGHHPLAGHRAITIAREVGVLTLADAGSFKAHVETWMRDIDVVAASAKYSSALGGTPAALGNILDRGTRVAIVTDGPREVRWRTLDGRHGRYQPAQVAAVDTLGAGDAFHGALLAALASHPRDLVGAIALAGEVATRRVSMVGGRRWLAELPTLP